MLGTVLGLTAAHHSSIGLKETWKARRGVKHHK